MVKVTNTYCFDIAYWSSQAKLSDCSSFGLICKGLLPIAWKCQHSHREYSHKK